MNIFKLSLIKLLTIFMIVKLSETKITVEQMVKAGELMQAVCQPKFKISDEDILAVHTGTFPDDKTVKCYVNCILEMTNAMRKGKILYEQSLKQIDLMVPDELKDDTKKSMENCKDSVNGIKDNCEAAYTFLKCIYSNRPNAFYP